MKSIHNIKRREKERKIEKTKIVNVSEAPGIKKILENSGFDKLSQWTIIAADGFESHDEILTLGDSDILNLAKGFYDRTVAAGNISFSLCWINILKATISWAHDFKRISWTPSLTGIRNAAKFRAAIEADRHMHIISKHSLEESDSLSKAADLVKLKRKNDWITWSRVLKNCLSTILGQDGVPLSYVIRECAASEYAI